jgi:hypothetical protein
MILRACARRYNDDDFACSWASFAAFITSIAQSHPINESRLDMLGLNNLLRPSRYGAHDINRVILLLWLLMAIGLCSLVFPAAVSLGPNRDWPSAVSTFGTGLFMAGAATLVGSILGFLFGVPRKNPELKDSLEPVSAEKSRALYQPNTNLEQISDWLTKIIVGIGLVELRNIIDFFRDIGTYCGPAFGGHPAGEIIAVSIAVHYTLVGFIQGFLLAYLWLPGAFARASKNAAEMSKENASE